MDTGINCVVGTSDSVTAQSMEATTSAVTLIGQLSVSFALIQLPCIVCQLIAVGFEF